MVRYHRSATCKSLDGSNNRATTKMATTSAHDTLSRPRGISSLNSSLNLRECHNGPPSYTVKKLRERSSLIPSSFTTKASPGLAGSNSSPCKDPLACAQILRASSLARARPCSSNSPNCDKVSCTIVGAAAHRANQLPVQMRLDEKTMGAVSQVPIPTFYRSNGGKIIGR